MHHDAMPEADPASLTEPQVVAKRLARLLEDPSVASGARVSASKWEPSS